MQFDALETPTVFKSQREASVTWKASQFVKLENPKATEATIWLGSSQTLNEIRTSLCHLSFLLTDLFYRLACLRSDFVWFFLRAPRTHQSGDMTSDYAIEKFIFSWVVHPGP